MTSYKRFGRGHLIDLENHFGGREYIAVSNKSTAIEMCLELLGSRTHAIPCVLPVTAPIETLTGVLRSGAQPLLLDVNPYTLHVDEKVLQLALEACQGAVVLLHGIAGHPIQKSVLDALIDVPTIVDWDAAPTPNMPACYRVGTFNVYDLSIVVDQGAVIHCPYEEQQNELRKLRDDVLGHNAVLHSLVCKFVKEDNYLEVYNYLVGKIRQYLTEKQQSDIILWNTPSIYTQLYFTVNDAQNIIDQLKQIVKLEQGVKMLTDYTEVKSRFMDIPKYPIAEQVSKQVIRLPIDVNYFIQSSDRLSGVLDKMIEVNSGTNTFADDDPQGSITRTSEE